MTSMFPIPPSTSPQSFRLYVSALVAADPDGEELVERSLNNAIAARNNGHLRADPWVRAVLELAEDELTSGVTPANEYAIPAYGDDLDKAARTIMDKLAMREPRDVEHEPAIPRHAESQATTSRFCHRCQLRPAAINALTISYPYPSLSQRPVTYETRRFRMPTSGPIVEFDLCVRCWWELEVEHGPIRESHAAV